MTIFIRVFICLRSDFVLIKTRDRLCLFGYARVSSDVVSYGSFDRFCGRHTGPNVSRALQLDHSKLNNVERKKT